MSIIYKIQNVLVPLSWSDEKKEQYLKERNLKTKFGNKRDKTSDNGFVHYVQYNKKTNEAPLMIDLDNDVKAFVEKKKVSYKSKRDKKALNTE